MKTISNFIHQHWVGLAVILGITTVSFFVYPGYGTFLSDQGLYIPQMLADETGLAGSRDLLVAFSQSDFSFFGDLILFIRDIVGGDVFTALLVYTIVSRILLIGGLWMLSGLFSTHKFLRFFAVLCMAAPVLLFGTAITPLDTEAHPRTLGWAMTVWSVFFLLKSRYFYSGLALIAAMLVHPITALVGVGFVATYHVVRYVQTKNGHLLLHTIWLMPALVAAFLMSKLGGGGSMGILTVIDSEWRSIISEETFYLYLQDWSWIAIISMVATLLSASIILVLVRTNLERKAFMLLATCIVVPVLAFLTTLIGGDILGIQIIIALQLMRSVIFLKLFFPIVLLSLFKDTFLRTERDFYVWVIVPFALLVLADMRLSVFILPILLAFSFRKFYPIHFNWFSKVILRYTALNVRTFAYVAVLLLSALVVFVSVELNDLLFAGKFFFVIGGGLTFGLLLKRADVLSRFNVFVVIILSVLAIGCMAYVYRQSAFSMHPQSLNSSEYKELCQTLKAEVKGPLFVHGKRAQNYVTLLRAFCGQEIYFVTSDVSQSVFNREYAIEWNVRRKLLDELLKGGSIPEVDDQGTWLLVSGKVSGTVEDVVWEDHGMTLYKVK